MKREEEIIKASVNYNVSIGKQIVMGGANMLTEEEFEIFNKNPHFIAGAEWADKTMIEKVRKCLIKGGYFVNNTETFDDILKALEE